MVPRTLALLMRRIIFLKGFRPVDRVGDGVGGEDDADIFGKLGQWKQREREREYVSMKLD